MKTVNSLALLVISTIAFSAAVSVEKRDWEWTLEEPKPSTEDINQKMKRDWEWTLKKPKP
ncbi:hypothetical protein BGZ83_008220, partial [Gryganskiella cystojenkinii]